MSVTGDGGDLTIGAALSLSGGNVRQARMAAAGLNRRRDEHLDEQVHGKAVFVMRREGSSR